MLGCVEKGIRKEQEGFLNFTASFLCSSSLGSSVSIRTFHLLIFTCDAVGNLLIIATKDSEEIDKNRSLSIRPLSTTRPPTALTARPATSPRLDSLTSLILGNDRGWLSLAAAIYLRSGYGFHLQGRTFTKL